MTQSRNQGRGHIIVVASEIGRSNFFKGALKTAALIKLDIPSRTRREVSRLNLNQFELVEVSSSQSDFGWG